MSKPNPLRKERPPLPVPGADDGAPPVPKPRVAGRSGRQPSASLPTWPPPGASFSSSPTPPVLSPSRSPAPTPLPISGKASPGVPRGPPPQLPSHGGGSGAHFNRTAPPEPPHQPPSHGSGAHLNRPVTPEPARPPHPSPSLPAATAAIPPSPASPINKNEVAFGSCLQEAQDAINKRHEDELHALESFRLHVFFRAKADREYAQELGKINSRATRTLASVSQSSPIVQAWKTYLDMCVAVQKMLTDGAVIMSGSLVPAIDQLYKDKKGAKKVFDSDRARMQKEYDTSTMATQTLRRDYQRLLKSTEAQKRKLEATSEAKAQEKYRRKFVAQANLLHGCHNDYALSLRNANTHQEHWRDSLLPFCLDTLQQRMELQITEWKDALSQYAQATDLTKAYQDSFNQFYEVLNVVEKEEEYVKFIQDNKQDQPGLDMYEFDMSLLSHYCSPSVTPGAVVLNNLTNTGIKTRLETLERELDQHSKDIATKKEELERVVNEPDDSSAMPSSPGAVQLPKHVKLSQLRGEVKELESFVARKSCQAQVIQEAADALGESPPPLFDPLGEGVDVRELEASIQASGGGGPGTGKSSVGGKVQATLFRGMRNIKGLGKKFKKGKKDADSLSTGGYPKVVFGEGGGEGAVGERNGDEPDSDEDEESLYDEPPDIPVEEEPWYYGDIDRRLAESKCKQRGDYLVRYSTRAGKYVLTCNNGGTAKHFMIQVVTGEDGSTNYRFEAKAFPRIADLLKYHVNNGMPVTRNSGAILLNAITKDDRWALRHSNVQVGKRIGKGAFGEVCEATLSNTRERVAVKTCRSNELQDMDKFLQEADILKQYEHPNVVRLIGVCAEKEPVYIVMELMPGGALLDYLRKKGGQQTRRKLCNMAIDACKGMEYLEQNNCIHRDLAARNCLVGDEDVVKIADFGMSREDEGGIYIVQSGTRNIPIKWTAPEGLNFGKYTSASDVWSYGILLWEVISCGSAPYPGMNNQEARNQVEMGYRMGPPADCPSDVHAIMSQCWQYEPEERPNFTQVLHMLNTALTKM